MTSAKHPTAQQSARATSKTDLIYWDTPHGQHGQPAQHEPSTKYPRPNGLGSLSDEKQHHWFETLRFRVQKRGKQCPCMRRWDKPYVCEIQKIQSAYPGRCTSYKHLYVRSETQWRQESDQKHRDHCTTKPQTCSRVSLACWKGIWAQACFNHQTWGHYRYSYGLIV